MYSRPMQHKGQFVKDLPAAKCKYLILSVKKLFPKNAIVVCQIKNVRKGKTKKKSTGNTGSPSAICAGSGFRGHLVEFGRNILELLVYYLMLNKCKNLKDMKASCLSVCTSSLYDNEGRYFLRYYM